MIKSKTKMSTLLVAIVTIVTMLLGAMFVAGAFKPVANNTVKADGDVIGYGIYFDNNNMTFYGGEQEYLFKFTSNDYPLDYGNWLVYYEDTWMTLQSAMNAGHGEEVEYLDEYFYVSNFTCLYGTDANYSSGNGRAWELSTEDGGASFTLTVNYNAIIEHNQGHFYESEEQLPWYQVMYIVESNTNNIINNIVVSGISSIDDYVFTNTSISTFTVPSGVTSIGSFSFFQCADLETVYIPITVTSIGDYAFGSSGIQNVYFDGTRAQWNNIIFGEQDAFDGVSTVVVHCSDETGTYDGSSWSWALNPSAEPEIIVPPSTGIELNIGVAVLSLALVSTLFVVARKKEEK